MGWPPKKLAHLLKLIYFVVTLKKLIIKVSLQAWLDNQSSAFRPRCSRLPKHQRVWNSCEGVSIGSLDSDTKGLQLLGCSSTEDTLSFLPNQSQQASRSHVNWGANLKALSPCGEYHYREDSWLLSVFEALSILSRPSWDKGLLSSFCSCNQPTKPGQPRNTQKQEIHCPSYSQQRLPSDW